MFSIDQLRAHALTLGFDLCGVASVDRVSRLDYLREWVARGYAGDLHYVTRSVEARIRLMDAAGRHEFPDEPRELAKLAYLLGYEEPDALAAKVDATWRETRARFDRIFTVAAAD